MISQAERSNFLRQCWRTRRWRDGVGTLLLPLREPLYRLRKHMLKLRHQGPAVAPEQVAKMAARQMPPSFSSHVHPIFWQDRPASRPPICTKALFEEVDAQLVGTMRFAGGRRGQLDANALEMRPDVEDVHAYHRLYWALRYSQAACFGHHGARNALRRDLPAWLNNAWQGSTVVSWPYTIAERITSLSGVLFWIDQGRLDDLSDITVPIKERIWKDAQELSGKIEYALGVHNHLLNDARGLFYASVALQQCRQAGQWHDQALALWDEYFPKLVLEDGTFAEQSSHYHLLLTRTALEYWLACRRNARPIAPGFESRFRAMFVLADNLLREDGSLPRLGDNSPDGTIADLWGMLAAAYHLGILERAPAHRAVTALTFFYCGASPALPAASPKPAMDLFPKGGFAFLRSTRWKAELVAHGDVRKGTGTHGDAGAGSYELWWNGDVLVREPGSFIGGTQTASQYFKSAQAQNVTSLDGLSPAIAQQDEKFLARWYSSPGGSWTALPPAGAEFRCEALRRLQDDIVVDRVWRLENEDCLVFEEKIAGAGRVQFESRICLGDLSWEVLDGAGKLLYQRADGASVEIIVSAPKNLAISIHSCKFLPEYGVEKDGRVLLLKGAQQLPCTWAVQWKFRMPA